MASPIAQAAIASKKPSNRCESHLGDVSRLSVSALFRSGNPGAVVGVNGTSGWADPCWRLGYVMGDGLIAEFCLTPTSRDRRNGPFRTLHFARIARLLFKPGSPEHDGYGQPDGQSTNLTWRAGCKHSKATRTRFLRQRLMPRNTGAAAPPRFPISVLRRVQPRGQLKLCLPPNKSRLSTPDTKGVDARRSMMIFVLPEVRSAVSFPRNCNTSLLNAPLYA
jgi:hypothetical protein